MGPPSGASRRAELRRFQVRGQPSLEDLVWKFRARPWPPVPPVCPPGLEAAAPAIDDPEPYVPGSFDDVVLAYDLGKITDVGYQLPTAMQAEAAVQSTALSALLGAPWGLGVDAVRQLVRFHRCARVTVVPKRLV